MLTEMATVFVQTLVLLFLTIRTSAQEDQGEDPGDSVVPYVVPPVVVVFVIVVVFTTWCVIRSWRQTVKQRRALGSGPGRVSNATTTSARSNFATTPSTTQRSDTAPVLPHSATITTAEGVSMNVPLPQMNCEQQQVMLQTLQQQGCTVQLSDPSVPHLGNRLPVNIQKEEQIVNVLPSASPLIAELSSQVPPPSYDAAVAYQTYTPEQVGQVYYEIEPGTTDTPDV